MTDLVELRKLNESNDILAYKPQSQFKFGTAAATAILADSTILPVLDENQRSGWLFKKTVDDASKFNIYFFAQTVSEHFTLGHLSSLSAVVSVDHLVGNFCVPFFSIYTKPTGSGDASWYKSKITGSLNFNSDFISLGERIQMYFGNKPSVKFGYREIKTSKSVIGTGLDSEEVWYITIHSDSSAPLDSQILISDLVYETRHTIPLVRTIRLIEDPIIHS